MTRGVYSGDLSSRRRNLRAAYVSRRRVTSTPRQTPRRAILDAMKVEMLYFADCPNARAMADMLDTLAADLGFGWESVQVPSPDYAEQLSFHGSPTLLIDGNDPFIDPSSTVGWSCRLYQTPTGPAGCPASSQLRQVLRDRISDKQH